MPDPEQQQPAPTNSRWSLDPTGGTVPPPIQTLPSVELDPRYLLRTLLPPLAPLAANGTLPGTADLFRGQYDELAPANGSVLDAAAAKVVQPREHPGGRPVGVHVGDRALQYAPDGGIAPGLVDTLQLRPYIDGVPGLSPPGMPPPWEPGR
jgi:hypothetical protein